jgi:uncharacterized membrane protein YfcA
LLEITDYIILFILGSFGAFTAGLLGVGGGIVYIPILDYFLYKLGLRDEILVKGILANSLFTIIFSGTVASYKQYRMGNFFPKEILYTAIPGVVTALTMTYLIRNGDWYSKTAFNYVFAAMMFIVVLRMFTTRGKILVDDERDMVPYKFSLTGFFAGFVTALSGLGGGVVMTPVFTDVLKVNIKKASSISNGVIPIFALAIGIYNLSSAPPAIVTQGQVGFIVVPVVLPMILSTFIFAPLGVRVAQASKPETIRLIFGLFVAAVLVKLVCEMFLK